MDLIDLVEDRAPDAKMQVGIRRLDGSHVPVRVTLLSYDCCEFQSAKTFALNEEVSIHLYRMGWIRARITCVRPPAATAEFAKDCLV
jgi:hypothetical protein